MITRPDIRNEAAERHPPPRGRRWSLLAWALATLLGTAAAFTFSAGAASAQVAGTSIDTQQGQMLDDDPLHDGHEEESGTEGHDGHELDGGDSGDECGHDDGDEHDDDPLHDGHEEAAGTEGHDGHELDGDDNDDGHGHH